MNSNPVNLSDSKLLDKLIKEHPVHDSIAMNHFVENIISFGHQHLTGNNSSFVLFNIGKDRVIFNKSDITHHLIRPAVHTDIQDNRKLVNGITHPDDLVFWDKINLDTYKMMMTMPVEELNTFRVIGSRRLKEKDGRYRSYIQRIEPLVYPEMKYLMYIIVKTYRVKEEDIPQFRLYSRCTENYKDEHEYSSLLKNLQLCFREVEALNLYIEDNTEEKIAEKMGIELTTVKGYFREIKKKMKVHSIKVAALLWKLMREAGLVISY